MIDSDIYPLPQVDIPANNLNLQGDISPLQPNQENVQGDHVSSYEAHILSETVTQNKDALYHLSKAISLIQRIDAKHEIIFEPKYHKEEMAQKFVKLINVLKTLQVKFELFLEILKSSTEEEVLDILGRYAPISDAYKKVVKKQDLCMVSINTAFESVIFLVINQAEKATDTFITVKDDGTIIISSEVEDLDYVTIVTSKIEIIIDYLPHAVIFKPDNIFCYEQGSEMWKQIYKGAEIVVFKDQVGLQNQWKKIYTFLTIANAMVYKRTSTDEDIDSAKARWMSVMSGVYYGFKQKEAEAKSSLYLCDPKMDSAFKVWNFPEKKWIKEIKKFTLPVIDYDKKIYINRLFPAITKETILKEYEEDSQNTILENTFTPPDLVSQKDTILKSLFTKQADAVITRIISPTPLVLKGKASERARAITMMAMNKVSDLLNKNRPKINCDGIIIHVHGGGFVSGSSASHRGYLYQWAKALNKIIFSIDYRLAPDHPYPAGLDDIWQAYNWIINYAEPLLGIKTDKIILAGDSAGGNLAMAVTLRAIKMGVRVPDGCFLAYPALNMYPKNFSPSYWQSIEDMMLPCSLLNLCIAAYIPEEFRPLVDPFLSPRVAGDELLKRLPPVRICTGRNDPLHDDNWKFLHRMQGLNKDVKMLVYEGMPHAFLSFDNIEEYKFILAHSYNGLNELFSLADHNKSANANPVASSDDVKRNIEEKKLNAAEQEQSSEIVEQNPDEEK